MIKGKLSGMKSFDTSIMARIKIDQKTKKRYMQFRQKLADRYGITKQGNEGFTKLLGDDVDVNVFEGEKYMYLLIYGKNRKSVFSMLQENFEFVEPQKQ